MAKTDLKLVINVFDWLDNRMCILHQLLQDFGYINIYVALKFPSGMIKIVKIDSEYIKKHYVKPEKLCLIKTNRIKRYSRNNAKETKDNRNGKKMAH